MYWLPLIALLPHLIEEYPRFPAWATRHFGATSNAWYVYSHVVLVAGAVPVCAWADSSPPQTWGPLVGTALMIALGLNGLFHIVTLVRFREYSPGVVTGTLVLIPSAVYVLFKTVHDSLLTANQIVGAAAIGAALVITAVASLYLRLDFDWHIRNTASIPARSDSG